MSKKKDGLSDSIDIHVDNPAISEILGVETNQEEAVPDMEVPALQKSDSPDNKKNEEPGVDPEADKDAGNKEIIAYVLGGTATQIADSDIYLKQNLMMFVLQLNPVLISFMGVFGMLWDAITDPIMANISDNSHNRWGRRRPFILVGGVIGALASILIWYNFPRTDKMRKNSPDIPAVYQSDDSLEKFGKMMSGYGISKVRVKLDVPDNYAMVKDGKTNRLDDIIKSSFKKMSVNVAVADDNNSENYLPLTLSTEGFKNNLTDDKVVGHEMSAMVSLGKKVVVKNNLKIEPEYKENRSFSKTLEDLIKLRNKYIGLNYDGENIDYNYNTFEQSGLYRARVSLLEKCIIEALGKHYNLPYWQVFPERSDQEEPFRKNLVLSDDILKQKVQGFNKEDIEVYDSVLDSLISSIEKRNKYNKIKIALQNQVVDENIKGILKKLKLEEKEKTAFEKGFNNGKLSNKQIAEINKKWFDVSNDEIKLIKDNLIKQHNGNLYSAYKNLHSKIILYGLGHKINMSVYTFSDNDKNIISNLFKNETLISGTNLYSSLWGSLNNPFHESEVQVKLEDAAGIIVVICGFDVDLGAYQKEGVFTTMRMMFSFIPAFLLSFSLLLLYKYPLTRKRMYEIKAILKERRAAAK